MKKLSKKEIEQQARWWNTFNGWNWPEDYPKIKPKDFDSLPILGFKNPLNYYSKNMLISPNMEIIVMKIGMKECMRWHWLHNLKRTNSQFEWWWFKNNVSKVIRFLGFESFYWY